MTYGLNVPHTKSAEKRTYSFIYVLIFENLNWKLKNPIFRKSFLVYGALCIWQEKQNHMNWKSLLRFSEGHQPKIFDAIRSFQEAANECDEHSKNKLSKWLWSILGLFIISIYIVQLFVFIFDHSWTIWMPNRWSNHHKLLLLMQIYVVQWLNLYSIEMVAISFHFDFTFVCSGLMLIGLVHAKSFNVDFIFFCGRYSYTS